MLEGRHPAILAFKSTLHDDAKHPLIMCVGREPNGSHDLPSQGVGGYDFVDAPRCAFWNVSHAVLGRLADKQLREVKALCQARALSPIIYANALPITIKNEVVNKNALRNALSDEHLKSHAAHTFSFDNINKRLGLVILSGHGAGERLGKASDMFREQCAMREIPCIAVPFFYPTNTQKIMDALGSNARSQMTQIWTKSFG